MTGGPLVISVRQVAVRLGRSAEWVRDHRDELGLVAGQGARPRLLFDAAAVERWATARDEVVQSQPAEAASPLARSRKRRSRVGSGVDLLPVQGARVDREAA